MAHFVQSLTTKSLDLSLPSENSKFPFRVTDV